ncbi:MAG: pilus assembly protein PilM [Pseudomonadota bacterium]
MKKTDEISSTEKLLHVIRNRNETSLPESKEVRDDFIDREFKPSFFTVVPFKKKLTLSITIGSQELILVLLSRVSDQDVSLPDHDKIAFTPEIRKDAKQFSVFLRSSIVRFLGSRKPDYVWSTIPSVKIETRFLTIPKVSFSQIPRVAFFTFNKVNPVSEEGLIFDFEVLGEVSQGGSQKLELFAYTAVSKEVEQIRKLFHHIGLPLTGISIVPFAMQNIFRSRLMGELPANICTLYVGKDWSRIDIFSKGNLVLSRDIKTGINSIVEAARGRIDEKSNRDETEKKDQDPEDQEFLKNIFRNLPDNEAETDGTGNAGSLPDSGMLEIVMPVIRRLVRQVERTLEHFSVNFDQEPVGKIFITGDLSAHPRIIDLISRQLNFPIDCIDLFTAGTLRVQPGRIPESVYEKDTFAPAIGLAVSSNSRTPNLLYTYLQKGIHNRIQKINRYVFFTFLAVMTACSGFFYWQDHAMKKKQDQIAQLNARLESFSPLVEKKLILQMISVLESKRKATVSQAESSLCLAMLSELSRKTPENIRITGMDAQLLRNPSDPVRKKLLLIQGLVFPGGSSPDADLAVYLMKLGESPIFKQVSIREKTIQTINGRKVLQFTAKLEPV